MVLEVAREYPYWFGCASRSRKARSGLREVTFERNGHHLDFLVGRDSAIAMTRHQGVIKAFFGHREAICTGAWIWGG